jgi:crotonobetainyl-CoA:carnitine CoA-transferase CaiB-like acyl-CoA transferase
VLYELIEAIAAGRTNAEWLGLLTQAQIPCAPINSLEDLFADPHLQAGDLFATMDHPSEGRIQVVNSPMRFSASPAAISRGAPLLGQHSREILREAGIADTEIAALVESGIVVEPKQKNSRNAP